MRADSVTRRNTPQAWPRRFADIVRDVAFPSIDELQSALRDASYLPERGLSTALFLSLTLQKPLLLEGEAGVGKTEAAKALATATGARLIRLQCYEGLDVAHAVYEWNYSRQLLHIRAAQEGTVSEQELFGPNFFKELVVSFTKAGRTTADVNRALRKRRIFGGKDLSADVPTLGESALYCVTEMHTQADISETTKALGYQPKVRFWEGLERTLKWWGL